MPESVANRGFDYRAFISYSHTDRKWCDWLHKALETYRVPQRLVNTETAAGIIPRRLTPIFRDRDELPSASDLNRKVADALARSANLIVICSPNAARSRWVNEEVLAFKRLGHGDRIFCLIVEGEPNAGDLPGRETDECFVPALRFQLGADGQPTRERTEPIAADARAGKDGKANAKLKLIAGMLDVGFDKLKQRELQRRNRRMAAITALAVIVMLVTSALAIDALIARRAAQVAQQAAERRQKQAESLVNFMLGDLNDKLAQMTRLDIMESVDDQAMKYFESLPTTDVTDEALAQRAKALEKIGSVRMDQGHLPTALESYQASAKLAAKLADAAPDDTARQVAYARILTFIGQAYWQQGQLDAAQQSYASAQAILQRAQSHAANDLQLQYHLALIDNDIGHVLEARGRLDDAAIQYRNTLELSRKLFASRPDDTALGELLGGAHNNLGKLALIRGDLAAAISEYAADNVIETRLSSRNPKDNDQRQNMMRVRAILGRTLALSGDVETGTRDLQQAIDIATQLTTFDPRETDFQDLVALYSAQLGRLRRLSGDLPAANSLLANSIAIFSALTKQDPTNIYWQSDFAQARLEQAAQLHDAGQTDAARTQAQAALNILKPLLAKQPDDRATVLATIGAKMLLASIIRDAQAAQQLRNDALKAVQDQKSGRNDPRLLALQVEAMLALGEQTEAQPVIKQLWNSGYRDLALLDLLQREHIDYPVNTAFQQRLFAATSKNNHQ